MLPPAIKIFLATEPTDLRRSFDTLGQMVRSILRQDPFSGHLFVFVNRTRNRMKILYWESSGFWLCHKRLERGTFCLPDIKSDVAVMSATELALILEGLDFSKARQRTRYQRSASE